MKFAVITIYDMLALSIVDFDGKELTTSEWKGKDVPVPKSHM